MWPTAPSDRGRRLLIMTWLRRIAPPVVSLLALGAVWEFAGQFLVPNQLILVPPSAIVGRLGELIVSGELIRHGTVSLIEFSAGFGLAVAIGLAIGVSSGVSERVKRYIDAPVNALYATPVLALSPLFILWLGIDLASKIAVVFLVSVFPIIINVQAGIRETPRMFMEAVKAFGGSNTQVIMKARIPYALPFFMAGVRVSVARAIAGMFVAELFAARAGIGFLIFQAMSVFDTPTVYAGVVVLAGFGVIVVALAGVLERKLAPWHAASLEAEATA